MNPQYTMALCGCDICREAVKNYGLLTKPHYEIRQAAKTYIQENQRRRCHTQQDLENILVEFGTLITNTK